MKMTRVWAMPSPYTFSIPPIAKLLDRWVTNSPIIDPFAGKSLRADFSNDLAESGLDAETFVRELPKRVRAKTVLFDPPYSPRQISEVYKSIGLTVGKEETQNGRFYRRVKEALNERLDVGGIAVCCGWNSGGFGKTRGYEFCEILLVAHGGAHNDTIVTVERKVR